MTHLPPELPGDPVTFLITGTRGHMYRSRDRLGPADILMVLLGDGTQMPVPPDRAGVHLLPPNALETFAQVFADALAYHDKGANPVCECATWTARYVELRDALGIAAP